jgi:hypothetical protein
MRAEPIKRGDRVQNRHFWSKFEGEVLDDPIDTGTGRRITVHWDSGRVQNLKTSDVRRVRKPVDAEAS